MSVDQVAINHRAVTTQAERLTATGWDGDAHRFVESLLLNLLADGYRRIEAPPPLRGRGSSDEARQQRRGAAPARRGHQAPTRRADAQPGSRRPERGHPVTPPLPTPPRLPTRQPTGCDTPLRRSEPMSTTTETHVLVVTFTACDENGCTTAEPCEECREYGDFDFTIECPGVSDRCRLWWECMDCTRRAGQGTTGAFSEHLAEEPEHGVQHQWVGGMWATPSESCYVALCDHMPDAAADLGVSEPGRYPVDFGFGDPGDIELFLIKSEAVAESVTT